MQYIILIIFLIIVLIALKIICKINIAKLKKIAKNKLLEEKTNKFPNNIEICEKILKKLENESVKIEENPNASNCLYLVLNNI